MEIMENDNIPPPTNIAVETSPRLDGYYFNPTKKIKDVTLKQSVRALHKMKPCFDLNKHEDIFQALWSGIPLHEVAPTSQTRIALGVLGFLAHLARVSPRVRTLLDKAPDKPNCEFHIVNALLATVKYTAKPGMVTCLLKKTLQFLVAQTAHIPDVGKPSAAAPFPIFSLFVHSFVDLMACTPRLTVDYRCTEPTEDENHKIGYRLQGHFLDALHVASNETSTLAEILTEYEEELIQGEDDVPLSCSLDHLMEVHASDYGAHGPPPLLFFEAIAQEGIPRRCITEQVSLGGFTYALASVISLEPNENNLVLETGLEQQQEQFPVALVVYVRDNKEEKVEAGEDDDDVNDDAVDSIEE